MVQALRSSLRLDSYFGAVIFDCLDLWRALPVVEIVFVKKSANKAAHSLARFSCCIVDRLFQFEDLDTGTLAALEFDCK